MRELTYYVATSLDGFIAAPDGTWGDFADEGDHMSVVVGEFADALPGQVRSALGIDSPPAMFDTVIMGWNTYTPALDVGITSPYPHLTQIVATRTRTSPSENVSVTGDPIAAVREQKRAAGAGIWLAGGGLLAGALIEEIDHLVVKVNPVVLGAGVPLFAGAPYAGRAFARHDVRTFESGVVISRYARVRDAS